MTIGDQRGCKSSDFGGMLKPKGKIVVIDRGDDPPHHLALFSVMIVFLLFNFPPLHREVVRVVQNESQMSPHGGPRRTMLAWLFA